MDTSYDIFLSHVEEDFPIVEELAHALESQGYATWYYERDGVIGEPYLITIERAIRESRSVLVLISSESLEHSHQIDTEVFHAYERQKRFFPLLRDVDFEEFRRRNPQLHLAIAGAVAVSIPPEGVGAVVPTLLRGLKAAGLEPAKPAGPPPDPLEQDVAAIRTMLNDPEKRADADKAIDDLLEREPSSAQAWRLRAEYCNRMFRHREAVEALERATGLEPEAALGHWELALAYRQVGRKDDAVAELRRALDLRLDQSRQRHAMTLLAQLDPGGR